MENNGEVNNNEIINESEELHVVEPVGDEILNEPVNVFAEGLPKWSIEPPQVMVRRRRHL